MFRDLCLKLQILELLIIAQTFGAVEKPFGDKNEGRIGCFTFLFRQEPPYGSTAYVQFSGDLGFAQAF